MQEVNKLAIAVNGASASKLLIDTGSCRVIGLEIKNSGANPLNALDIKGRVASGVNVPANSGTLVGLLSAAIDYSTPTYPCLRTIGAPVTLAAGASALIFLNVEGLANIEVWAGSAAATTIDVHAAVKFLY